MEDWKRKVAKKAHHLALEMARKQGRVDTFKGRDGYVIDGVVDGVYGFIMQAASNMSVSVRDGSVREEIRVYLKDRQNLGTLGKPMRDGSRRTTSKTGRTNAKVYRIFVSAQWSEDVWTEPSTSVKTIKFRERSKFKREPGGECGPVTEWNLSKEFSGNNIIAEESAGLLYALHQLGGAVYDQQGGPTALDAIRKIAPYSNSSVKTLVERELITTFKTHPKRKRISGYELTDKGKWAARNLTFTQAAEVRLAKVLADLGTVAFDRPREATETLGRLTHTRSTTCRVALTSLIEAGKVEVMWHGDAEVYPSRLKWIGGTPPGWHVEDFTNQQIEQEKQQAPVAPKATVAKENKSMATKSDSKALDSASVDELLDALIEKVGQPQTNKAAEELVAGVREIIKKAHAGDMSPFLALAQLETVLKSYDEASK